MFIAGVAQLVERLFRKQKVAGSIPVFGSISQLTFDPEIGFVITVMPHNLTKKRYKKKVRSCAMCKPHKTNGADRRTLQQQKADEDLRQQIG